MAKSNRIQSKKTSRSSGSATRSSAKAGNVGKRAASKAKRAAAPRGKVNGTAVAARAAGKAPKKAAKATSAKKVAKRTTRGKGRQIDVKVGTFGGNKPGSFGFGGSGGGMSFLSGKPGSGAADSKAAPARLTRTKLNAKELRYFRDLLLTKRRQLLGDMETMENEALRTETSNLSHLPVHMADMGTDNYEQEFTLSLVDRDRQVVDEIDAALRKIEDKTYGICEGTGQMITKERLEAKPWARYTIEYARHLQRPGIRR